MPGWFGETAADLNNQGVAVYGPDRRGSGRSGGPRGHLDRYERALDDVEEMVRLVSSEHPATPIFLAASSWAAKLAVVYAAQRPGAAVGAAAARPRPAPSGQPLTDSTALRRRRPPGRPDGSPAHPLTPELYTANPPYLDFIRDDRLRLLEATTRFFWETARLDRRRSARLRPPGAPLLLLQGEDDKMMDVAKTRRWFARLGVEDKTYLAYPAPATPWTSSRTAAGTWPTCSPG